MLKFALIAMRLMSIGILIGVFGGPVAAQQAYPSKPIRFILPYPPGGSTSTLARLVGQKLTESWGQQVIVDNRGGASTIIGTETLVKSAPDGYTILLVATTHVINPLLLRTPYDAIKDFAPVATLGRREVVLVVTPSVPANNLQELIALAKSRPGQLNYGTPGAGGIIHVVTELFQMMAGVKMHHIPYKGTGPVLTDVMGGHIQLYFSPPSPVISLVKSGKLKAMAISGETRLGALPEVPTFTEGGLPGYNVASWHGVLAPAGTPKEIITKLSTEITKILRMPEINEKLASEGVEAFISTPEQFAALLKADMAKYARIIKTANIKLEN